MCAGGADWGQGAEGGNAGADDWRAGGRGADAARHRRPPLSHGAGLARVQVSPANSLNNLRSIDRPFLDG